MEYPIKKSQTARPLLFLMIDSSDHVSPKTGLTPTVTLSKNGAAFASPAGAVSEVSNGWYKVAGNATDSGTSGPLLLHATGSGSDPVDVVFEVVAYDPDDGVRMGLTALPNAAAAANGGLATLDASLRLPAVASVFGTIGGFAAGLLVNGRLVVVANLITAGTAQAGAAATITLAAGETLLDQTIKGATLRIVSGLGAGQTRIVTSYVSSSKVAAISPSWFITPDNTSVYELYATNIPFSDSAGAVAYNNPAAPNALAIAAQVDATLSGNHGSGAWGGGGGGGGSQVETITERTEVIS